MKAMWRKCWEVWLLPLLLFGSCSDPKKGQSPMEVDFSDPAKVVLAIFESAKLGEREVLKNLCDWGHEMGIEVRRICELGKDSTESHGFAEWFEKGDTTGAALIRGDTAWVPILYGPTGKKLDTLVLVHRNDKWLLQNFGNR